MPTKDQLSTSKAPDIKPICVAVSIKMASKNNLNSSKRSAHRLAYVRYHVVVDSYLLLVSSALVLVVSADKITVKARAFYMNADFT